MKTLILGGVRSGKSRHAAELAHRSGGAVTLIATAQAHDAEMAARIAAHRASRPSDWGLVEEPTHLAAALTAASRPERFVIVDCLTLWLTNLLCDGEGRALARRFADEAGNLHQKLAVLCDRVVLMAAGLPLAVKP